jgi:4-hydroxythreonine-4-phosphate dehydrogenase
MPPPHDPELKCGGGGLSKVGGRFWSKKAEIGVVVGMALPCRKRRWAGEQMTDRELMRLPRIAITMGDPAGVGPEVCLRALAAPEVRSFCVPVVLGEMEVLQACAERTGLPPPLRRVTRQELAGCSKPSVLDEGVIGMGDFEPGKISGRTGRAAFAYVERSIELAMGGEVDAVSTGPLNKEALRMAGIQFPGHTEIYTERTGAKRTCMMQYSEEITCTFVTVHVGYSEVPRLLTQERILEVIELTAASIQRIRGRAPRMVVCGLNPHAGEHGLFGGQEEERVIEPAIEAGRALGYQLEGPVPPDTAFLPWKRRETDAYICMYHDQGHIPLKALAFDTAVNTTLGLPMIRTSVDHGTALDIAWKGKARADSLLSALRLAARLAR